MGNDTLALHSVIPASDAPGYEPPTDKKLQSLADDNGLEVSELQQSTVVPAAGDIGMLENNLQETLLAMEHLARVSESLKDRPLTASAARALSASLEAYKINVRLPSAETFTAAPEGAAFYAREAVATQERTLLERIIDFLVQWGRSVLLWLRSLMNKRVAAQRSLDYAKKELDNIKELNFAPRVFQGRGLLSNASTVEGSNVQEMATSSVKALEALTAQMRAMRSVTSSMFKETPDDQTGFFGGFHHINRLMDFFKKNNEFNPAGLSGVVWSVTVKTAVQFDGGDTLPKFAVVRSTVDRMEVTGKIDKATFSSMLLAASGAMDSSASVIESLEAYARKLSVLNIRRMLNHRGLSDSVGAQTASQRAGVMECLVSTAGVLRACAGNYESIVLNYALDCGRAVKYASRKA